jgi:3-hydroxybutyryl-CoA dehydrogenase
MTVTSIGIIGAGTMGNGIAQVAASAGYDVVLLDVSDAALEKGLAALNNAVL